MQQLSFILLFIILSSSYSLATNPCERVFQNKTWKTDDPYFVGTKETKKLLRIGYRFRKNKVNPHATHIQEFADQVTAHYKHFKNSLETHPKWQDLINSPSNKSDQQIFKIYETKFKTLDFLYQEALSKIKNKQITYSYWLHWNIRITKILNTNNSEELDKIKNESYLNINAIEGRSKIYSKELEEEYASKPRILKKKLEILQRLETEISTLIKDDWDNTEWGYHKYLCRAVLGKSNCKWEDIQKIRKKHSRSGVQPVIVINDFAAKLHKSIELFPAVIALPTIENLGIVALNKFKDGIIPLGLGSFNSIADGNKLNHFDFISHDLNHHHLVQYGYPTHMSSLWKDKTISKEEFLDAFLKVTESYPIDEYKKAHLAYFIQSHEKKILVKKVSDLPSQTKKVLESKSFIKSRFKNVYDLGPYLEIENPTEKDILNYVKSVNQVYKKTIDQVIELVQKNNIDL